MNLSVVCKSRYKRQRHPQTPVELTDTGQQSSDQPASISRVNIVSDNLGYLELTIVEFGLDYTYAGQG